MTPGNLHEIAYTHFTENVQGWQNI